MIIDSSPAMLRTFKRKGFFLLRIVPSQSPRVFSPLRMTKPFLSNMLAEQSIDFTKDNPRGFKAPATWKDFSFRDAVGRYERFLIEIALREAGGVVTRAARLLVSRTNKR